MAFIWETYELHEVYTLLYSHNAYTKGPTRFSKNLGATSKFMALKG